MARRPPKQTDLRTLSTSHRRRLARAITEFVTDESVWVWGDAPTPPPSSLRGKDRLAAYEQFREMQRARKASAISVRWDGEAGEFVIAPFDPVSRSRAARAARDDTRIRPKKRPTGRPPGRPRKLMVNARSSWADLARNLKEKKLSNKDIQEAIYKRFGVRIHVRSIQREVKRRRR